MRAPTATMKSDAVGERTLLVTGGSRGIGAATCRLAAARGWAVAVNYTRDAGAADAVVAAIVAGGGRALAVQADVADDRAVTAMFAAIDRALPPLAGLVNNAGIVDVAARVDAISVERLQRMFAINVFGSFYCAREAIRRMTTKPMLRRAGRARRRRDRQRLVGGGQARRPRRSTSTMPPPRAGSRPSRSAWRRSSPAKGSASTRFGPGIIDTEIHASGGTPDRVRQIAPQLPMQRAGTADEVAEAIVWLLSDASSYTTGSIVEVTGGR